MTIYNSFANHPSLRLPTMQTTLRSLFKKSRMLLCITLLMFLIQYHAIGQNCSVNADVDISLCANLPMTLNGSKSGLFQSAVTTWSQVSGPSVTITNPSALITTVTGYTGGNIYKFRLSTTCMDGSLVYDEVTFTVKTITIANAGPDQLVCPGTPAGTLAGNAVVLPESGVWSKVAPR